VYHGVHAKLGRPAAIKVLGESTSAASFTTRFFNEARLQASLHHPNIAALYDFQEINNRLCIFMEFVNGESLEDLVVRRAFTVEDALKTFLPVVEAIAFIHQNGILHRDIKSQNIKLTSGGTVKLLDFGIAKDATSHSLTQTGGVIGTPSYLAPEQLEGKSASAQTDVWALGVLLYEMLTGSEPFKADTIGALCMQIKLAKFELPEKVNPAVSREVSQIVVRCMEKHPEERYRTADEILADVQRVLRGEKPQSLFSFNRPTGFSPKSTPENSASGNSQNRNSDYGSLNRNSSSPKKFPYLVVAMSSAAAVLLVFGVVGIGIWAMSNSNPDKPAQNSSTPKPIFSSSTKPVAAQTGSNTGLIRMRVHIDEGSAQVFRNGQLVGTTPFELEGEEGETVNVTLKREGFESKDVPVNITTRKKVVTVSLKPKR
jgi:serine/threonine-protein kinase